MKKILRMSLNLALVLSMLITSLSCIFLYSRNRSLQRVAADAIRASTIPHVISGMHVNLLSLADQIEIWPTTAQKAENKRNPRVLLIVVTNSCGFCSMTVPKWKQIIQQVHWAENEKEVWLVTFEKGGLITDPLIEWLRRSHTPFKHLLASNRYTFPLYTGISSVPTTLVIDENNTARLMCFGELTDEGIRLFTRTLNGAISEQSLIFLRPMQSGIMPLRQLQLLNPISKGDLK